MANPIPAPTLSFFRVELYGVPAVVVAARDTDHAWEVYRERSGIRETTFTPSISNVSGPTGVYRGDTFHPDKPAE